ncbi:MAG: hypothetical protein IT345_10670 [Trueperaceae bacterium]|nr:hypothetical protein [Trueperaceae bacterium]
MGYTSSLRSTTGKASAPKRTPLGGPSVGSVSAPQGDLKPGQFSIDIGDIAGSIGDSIGSVGEFGANAVGGVAGAVGSVGFGDGKNIGALADIPGNVLGGIGEVGIPGGPLVKDVVGRGGDVLDFGAARLREVQASARASKAASELRFKRATGEDVLLPTDLPPDLLDALDRGASVDDVAEELLNRGQAYSSNPAVNIASEVVFDPLNFISFGAAGAIRAGKAAGMAVKAGQDIGLGQRFMGSAYNVASKGLSDAGSATMDAVLGPTTKGIFHALGTKPYLTIKSNIGKLNPAYANAFEDSLSRGAAQLPRAVIARQMAEELGAGLTKITDRIGATIESRLGSSRATRASAGQLERRAEELLRRVTPDFLNYTPERLLTETAGKLAKITGMSVEDATRALGKVDGNTARTMHLAYYGHAGDTLARAKAASRGAKNIDVERLTPLAPDTLTMERAQTILAGTPDELSDAVDLYGDLAARYGGKLYDHAEVRKFIQTLVDNEALPTTVKQATTGKNALPGAVSKWRQEQNALDFGYDLGFSPKEGWRAIRDKNGDLIYNSPFVHFVSEADPLTVRNPLGRFTDSLLRGTTQTTIILESRARMVEALRPAGVSPAQAKSIHKAVLNAAADKAVSPRGLAVNVGDYDAIFKAHLTTAEFEALTFSPTWYVMKAFEGNWKTVGLTQKLTGAVKTGTVVNNQAHLAAVTDFVYPLVRFRSNVFFQLQEAVESPFFNALRGIRKRRIDDDVAAAYRQIVEVPDFRHLAEAGYTLNIAGSGAVRKTMGEGSALGKALQRFPNVQDAKAGERAAQVMFEHGDEFQKAVESINPRLWQTMTDAYGTTDARLIADRFITERLKLASSVDETMEVFDSVRTLGNSLPEEAVWQAFRDSLRQTSQQAFKTHFFSPERGFLERTINHPYLGIYPASYMWGKVLPEFARFMLKKPFGLDAPLVGFAQTTKVHEALLSAIADDPEFQAYLKTSGEAVYVLEMLIPGDPFNLGAGLPAWARHLSTDIGSGKVKDAESAQGTLERTALDTAGYAFGTVRGPFTLAGGAISAANVAGDIFSDLTRSAEQYDRWVPLNQ